MATPQTTDQQMAIPDVTTLKIRDLDKGIRAVRAAHTDGHASARLQYVYRVGAELKTRSNELVSMMEKGNRWLDNHKDHPMFTAREDEWLQWLHEYEAIEDALERAKGVL